MNNYIAFGIISTLIKYKKCSCQLLAEKFEVSKKTIYRYVTELSASGVPIFCVQGKNGGIEIMPDFDLESNFFTTDEIARISFLLSTCEIRNIDKTTQSVIEKINYTLHKHNIKWGNKNICNQIIIDNLPWGVDKLYNKKILLLLDACQRNEIIEIEYVNRNNIKSSREIEPYSLVLKDGVWYLYAFCKIKTDFRLFKCTRIMQITPCKKIFTRIAKKIEDKPWLNLTNMGKKIELKMQVKNLALPDIFDWVGEAIICEKNQESTIVKSDAVENDGLITRLLNFGDKIKVLSPISVTKKLIAQCNTITNVYQN